MAMIIQVLVGSVIVLFALAVARPFDAVAGDTERDLAACDTTGIWLDPASGQRIDAPKLMARLAEKDIVLLGEQHTRLEHHRWQLQTMAGLAAYAPELVIGFEMFPRSVQAVLDAWSEGDLSENEFLAQSRWADVWGYAPGPYLPLFHFARQNRIPMVALNVDRALISKVGQKGWTALPENDREGLSDPAPAAEEYRRALADVFREKLAHGRGLSSHHGGETAASGGEDTPENVSEILRRDDFQRFVEAQLTWDRAMAEALYHARQTHPQALIIGVMGQGHVEHGHGVPHQLTDLGLRNVAILLPVETGPACAALAPDVADAVFLIDSGVNGDAAARPRLGVAVEAADGGVRVLDVSSGSIAETAGLAAGDVILRAAEVPIMQTSELIGIIQRQAPGTWLPLEIRRDGEKRQLVAKFPALAE